MKHIKLFEEFVNESTNIKDIKVGSILNFKDGEVWKVTKVMGPTSNPRSFLAKPHDENTKKHNTSIEIEMKPDFLEKELESINEANEPTYKVAGRTVTLNKGEKEDGTDWTVTFPNGDEKPLSDVLALIKPFPKSIKESLDEATTSWSKMMKGVRAGETGPWSLVAIQNKKVVAQEIDIRIKDMLPASFEKMRKDYPKASIHIEDGTGQVVWTDK